MPVNIRLEPTRCWIAQLHHILASGQECYNLGPDYYERRDTDLATDISEQQGDRRMSYLDVLEPEPSAAKRAGVDVPRR